MARSPLPLIVSIAAFLPVPGGAAEPRTEGPGCIAAVTSVPIGQISSGETVTLTDGSVVSPTTRFLSRTWSFGDGDGATSTQAAATTVTHEYVNTSSQVRAFTVRLVVRTAAGTCTTSLHVQVAPAS